MDPIEPLDSGRFLVTPEGLLEIRGSICNHCGVRSHPARENCPGCSEDMSETTITDHNGVIESFTVVHQEIAQSLIDPPYVLAEIRLNDGNCIRCVSTEELELSIGSEVSLTTRKLETGSGTRLGLVFALKCSRNTNE